MKSKLLLFPCGGNAREALDAIDTGAPFEPIGFVDDDPSLHGKKILGLPVYSREAFTKFPEARVLAVPGSPANYLKRMEWILSLGIAPERFATVIHPLARVSRFALVGKNTLLQAGVQLLPGAEVGDHCVVLPGTIFHHDSVVEDGAVIGSQVILAGFSRIGKNTFIGSGARIRERVAIGEGALVGMGSVVLKNVLPGATVAGVPAREVAP